MTLRYKLFTLLALVNFLYLLTFCSVKSGSSQGRSCIFDIKHEGKSYDGKMIVNKNNVTLQLIKPPGVEFDSFRIYGDNSKIKLPVEWTCALSSKLEVINCSTDPAYVGGFYDGQHYNIRLIFFKYIDLSDAKQIDVYIDSNQGEIHSQ